MKYTLEERLGIGRRIYNGEISRYQAAEEYGISDHTARDYMRLYRNSKGLRRKEEERRQAKPCCLRPNRPSLNP